jgi:hypothetical protein
MFRNKKYLAWGAYAKLVGEIEHVRFIDQTFKMSMSNVRRYLG